MVWGPLIAWYLFLAGAAAGAFVTAAVVGAKYPEARMTRLGGRILAPVMLGVGLVMLMVDAEAGLHNPLRFFYLVMNPGSVMTLGVYVICVFMPVALVSALLEVLKRPVPKWLTWIGIVAAFCVAAYTGFLLGVVVTVLRLLPLPPLRFVLTGYVEIFRNIPSVALLIFIVFALPDLNVVIDYEPSVVLALALVCSAFTADYLRAGINTIAGSQIEAALSLGMRPMQIITSVVLPQALRSVVQPMTSLLIALMLSTSLASQVPLAGRELTSLVSKIANDSAAGMAAFAVAAAMYVATGLLIAWAGSILEKKLRILR